MAFTAITSGEIASGKSNKTTTWNKVKDNFDDHEDRIETLEAAGSGDLPVIFRVNGLYGKAGAMVGVLKTTTNLAMTVSGVRILTGIAGSAGTLTVDIKRSRAGGAYASIFTTLPSVVYTAGDDALSTNAVLDPTMVDLLAGDILRLDITTVQTDGNGFLVRMDYIRS